MTGTPLFCFFPGIFLELLPLIPHLCFCSACVYLSSCWLSLFFSPFFFLSLFGLALFLLLNHLKSPSLGIPWWLSRLRLALSLLWFGSPLWCKSIPGLGISTCHGRDPKKKKKSSLSCLLRILIFAPLSYLKNSLRSFSFFLFFCLFCFIATVFFNHCPLVQHTVIMYLFYDYNHIRC